VRGRKNAKQARWNWHRWLIELARELGMSIVPYRTGRPASQVRHHHKGLTNPITFCEGPWHVRKDMRQQLKRAMLRCKIEENA
jgi:hypothetical protein